MTALGALFLVEFCLEFPEFLDTSLQDRFFRCQSCQGLHGIKMRAAVTAFDLVEIRVDDDTFVLTAADGKLRSCFRQTDDIGRFVVDWLVEVHSILRELR
jgi:hypothetical protein